MIKTHKIKYDTSEYQFRPLIKKILGENSLENLHEVKKYERYTEPTDQATMWHKTYYDKFQTEFYPLYRQFIEEFVKPIMLAAGYHPDTVSDALREEDEE